MINNKNILKNKWLKAFTLVEIMVWVVIFSIVLIGWFKAYSWVLIWKIKLIESTNIQKEAFYFSEKFFEEIKKWWTIDYEEYFNRSAVWTWVSNWHYTKRTWFWNFWKSGANNDSNIWTNTFGLVYYYCRSSNGSRMWVWWCINNNDWNTNNNVNNSPQRYWQYGFQFIDYNSNYDNDWWLFWDEDGDWNFRWDDDDEYLWEWPEAFAWNQVNEIYLISADGEDRTFFRWNIKDDPDDDTNTCNTNIWWLWCIWTVEFLKLRWVDIWIDHNLDNLWSWHEWLIDTWFIHEDFDPAFDAVNNIKTATMNYTVAWTNWNNYWEPLFWETINVSDVKFFAYPNKDLKLAWKNVTPEVNIAPYLRIQMTLSPSYKARAWIKWDIPKIKINTTISLTDIYSR